MRAESKNESMLFPGDCITVVWRSREIKWRNDFTFSYSGTAIKNPHISVQINSDLDLDYAIKFQSRHQSELLDLGDGRYEIKGTLLPLQGIRLRWWDRKSSEKWVKSYNEGALLET